MKEKGSGFKDNKLLEVDDESVTKLNPEVNEKIMESNSETNSLVSVFSIGPIPGQALATKNVQFSNPLVVGPSSGVSEMLATHDNLSKSLMEETNISKEFELSSEVDSIDINPTMSIETANEFSIAHDERSATSSSGVATSVRTQVDARVPERSSDSQQTVSDFTSTDVLDARAARLQSLEEQAKWLVKKVSDTSRRGSALNSRLEELHETYGSMPAAPPIPDVLPTFRISTETSENPSETRTNENPINASDNEEKPIIDDVQR